MLYTADSFNTDKYNKSFAAMYYCTQKFIFYKIQ